MANASRDTIYVDIDDEITALIDKVRASNAKVIALVLPKRASVLQSIVNMKLLKRSADNEKKNLVLITGEAGLLPLAGAVGLHVAKTLSSEPEIPPPPAVGPAAAETVNEDLSMGDDEEAPDLTKTAAKGASVGALSDAAKKAAAPPVKGEGNIETLELDNDNEEPDAKKTDKAAAAGAGAVAASAAADHKAKKVKVPNFNRFRMMLLLGGLALAVIIVLLIFAFFVWPHATIDIKTDASDVNTSLNLTLDSQTQSADYSSGDIPAKVVSEQKTYTQTVNTTGQQNNGNTASGQVQFSSPCSDGVQDIPAGTGVSTSNNLTYITQSDVVLNNASGVGMHCMFSGSTGIQAQEPGSAYNQPQGTSFTVADSSDGAYDASTITATGSASGGTDNIVQVVAQADVAKAESEIKSNNSGSAEQDLSNQLKGEGMYPVDATFTAGSPQTTASPNVGDQANTVTVTETITYTMFGAPQADVNNAVNANIHSQTSSGQNIISNGINQGAFKQQGTNGVTDQVTLATLAEVGPNISISQLKKEAAGKSPQAIISTIKNNPDVTAVSVKLSPFWVSSAPGSVSKITINLAKPSAAH